MKLSSIRFNNSADLKNSPILMCENELGYSVIECGVLTDLASRLVTEHIAFSLGRQFSNLKTASESAIETSFEKFKDKPARILGQKAVNDFLESLEGLFKFSKSKDFVTDEEGLGFPNIYWRLVRANHSTDIGPVHADKWFWDLGHVSIPPRYTRVKVWMPLIQDDDHPSLMILPGSHRDGFTFESKLDPKGKRKPTFEDQDTIVRLVEAPVEVGQAIVFNDNLLHGGRASDINRVSLEWTFAIERVL